MLLSKSLLLACFGKHTTPGVEGNRPYLLVFEPQMAVYSSASENKALASSVSEVKLKFEA
jgi:hypothetical protein